MDKLVKSFDVSVLQNKRLNDGILQLSPEGFFFYGKNDIYQERKLIGNYLNVHMAKLN